MAHVYCSILLFTFACAGFSVCKANNGETVTGCESRHVFLDCDNNQIDVISASYGRLDSVTCPGPRTENTNCKASASLEKVIDKCDKENNCIVPSTSVFFGGDPCPGTYKYLTVKYQCIEDTTCGQYAKCHDAATCVNDLCECTGDLIGDGVTECRPEVKCGKYPECLSSAVCVGNTDKKHCECKDGNLGDGYSGCYRDNINIGGIPCVFDQITPDLVQLMTDQELSNYLPVHGDRLRVRKFLRRNPATKKKRLLHILHEKLEKVNKRKVKKSYNKSQKGYESSDDEMRRQYGNKNAMKGTRSIELGRIHKAHLRSKQVRSRTGGGTRKVNMKKDATKQDMLQEAIKLFFSKWRKSKRAHRGIYF